MLTWKRGPDPPGRADRGGFAAAGHLPGRHRDHPPLPCPRRGGLSVVDPAGDAQRAAAPLQAQQGPAPAGGHPVDHHRRHPGGPGGRQGSHQELRPGVLGGDRALRVQGEPGRDRHPAELQGAGRADQRSRHQLLSGARDLALGQRRRDGRVAQAAVSLPVAQLALGDRLLRAPAQPGGRESAPRSSSSETLSRSQSPWSRRPRAACRRRRRRARRPGSAWSPWPGRCGCRRPCRGRRACRSCRTGKPRA